MPGGRDGRLSHARGEREHGQRTGAEGRLRAGADPGTRNGTQPPARAQCAEREQRLDGAEVFADALAVAGAEGDERPAGHRAGAVRAPSVRIEGPELGEQAGVAVQGVGAVEDIGPARKGPSGEFRLGRDRPGEHPARRVQPQDFGEHPAGVLQPGKIRDLGGTAAREDPVVLRVQPRLHFGVGGDEGTAQARAWPVGSVPATSSVITWSHSSLSLREPSAPSPTVRTTGAHGGHGARRRYLVQVLQRVHTAHHPCDQLCSFH